MVSPFVTALPTMRSQVSVQITGNGVVCDVKRFTASKDNTGRENGSWNSLISGGVHETMWIQPYSVTRGGSANVSTQGVNAETTHIGYQVYGGTAMIPKDRVIATGSAFAYDVVDVQNYDTHNEILLKQVRRV